MGVAHADNQDISFVKPLPEFTNIVCGGASSDYTFTLINNRNSGDPDDQITILSSKIYTESNDNFKHVSNFINITGGTCVPSRALYYNETCTINVEVNPSALESCPVGEVITGNIDRQLVVNVNTSQSFVETPIDFEVTPLGPVDQFALFGPNIFNTGMGPVSVSQDVAYTDSFLTTNIYYQPGATFFGPNNPITIDTAINLEFVFNGLFGLQYSGCTNLGNTIAAGGVTQTIYPGANCFTGNYPAVIDGPVYLNGDADDIFVLIVDYNITNNNIIGLSISEGAYFTLAPNVNPNNVFILVAEDSGSIEMCPDSSITATVLSYGTFEAEDASSYVTGRILLLGDADDDPNTENCGTYGNPCIALDSNTIIAP
jgi:hypothetical protein